jgi:hypothetical protein
MRTRRMMEDKDDDEEEEEEEKEIKGPEREEWFPRGILCVEVLNAFAFAAISSTSYTLFPLISAPLSV